jgi:phage-related protein
MPAIQVVFYQEPTGESPVVNWLAELHDTHRKAFYKCHTAFARLALLGHELRRPDADYLRDGIYELRVRFGSVNYRFLYFFHGQNIAIVAHGLTKEATIPAADLARALARKAAYTLDPAIHSFIGDITHA